MKTIRSACTLQPNALSINVGDQIERLDQIIKETNGQDYFEKTYITEGMNALLSKGMARLAGKSNDAVFHLKQAMGGGKTHVMVGFGLLAQDPVLRKEIIPSVSYQTLFHSARVAAFNGRNNPPTYFWGEIARQLGKESLFKEFWESGAKAPDEDAWIQLFEGNEPILILLDEMPPYFQYYSTQSLGTGTIADVVTRAFANMLTAAQKKNNVCIVVSDLDAAYETGGRLIQRALSDAKQEIGRAEVSITPVNLESLEIFSILRKRLFLSLPSSEDIAEIASVYGSKLAEAVKAKTVERSAESLSLEIESTYPFHPSFKSIVALFKDNEKFKQTRGLMELVSRLLRSVWESKDDIYLIGAQHFDLSILDVREKLAEISNMRDVLARDLWDSHTSAHAQLIDINNGTAYAQQVGTLLLMASLSTAVNSVRGLSERELLQYLIDPNHQGSGFKKALDELQKSAWYLHLTPEGRSYFSHQENLTKKLQGYAEKAPENKIDELIRHRLSEMYEPTTKEAYEKVLPLPEMDVAEAFLKTGRALLVISPDGKNTPASVERFFQALPNKNNVLVLTGDKSSMASIEKSARHVYAVKKADKELLESHPQRKELDEKIAQYEQDFQTTVLSVFDKLLFPRYEQGQDVLRSKSLDSTYSSSQPYNGEQQVIKTLTADPIKLYTSVSQSFDALQARAESVLFGTQDDARRVDLIEKMKQKTQMPWLPCKGFDLLLQEAFQRGVWEDLGNGYLTCKPRPKTTGVVYYEESSPDDTGMVRLKVEATNGGPSPKIHYEREGLVTENSKVLTDRVLETNALWVEFLAIDPTGANKTGTSNTWKNKLTLRNKFDQVSREVELYVVPRGSIRYTLDGSEPRNGMEYQGPISIGDATTVYVFAQCDDLEAKGNFVFAKAGSSKVIIKKDEPATLSKPTPTRLDSSQKTYDGLRMAKEKGIEFEHVMLIVGSSPKVINLSFGELRLKGLFLEETLQHFRALLHPDAPVVLTFKKLHTQTGFDLEQFAMSLGIEIHAGEVEQ